MNMKGYKAYLTAVLLLLLVGSTAGCFDDLVSGEYDGPPRVQFFPTGGAVLDGAGTVAINAQLISPHLPEDKQFPVTVVDTLTSAEAGVHYNLVSETFTIPANSSFGDVVVDVDSAGIAPGESVQVTLLVGASSDGEVTPAENFKFFTLEIVGLASDVETDPTSLDLGEVALDSMATDTLTISNLGTEASEITGLEIVSDTTNAFTLVEAPEGAFTLGVDESEILIIEFDPTEVGEVGALLTFMVTNDPDATEISAGLTGTGVSDEDNGDGGGGS